MRRGGTKSVAKLRARSQRPQASRGNARLAEMSARIDAARNASFVRRPVFNQTLDVVAYEVVLGDGPVTEVALDDDPKSTETIDVIRISYDFRLKGVRVLNVHMASHRIADILGFFL